MQITEKTVRFIELDGIKFYKSASGYWFGGRTKERPRRLHVHVWEKYNGPIPKGGQIHHIDGNKDNNEIENLQLLTKREHDYEHRDIRNKVGIVNIKKAMVAATEWHKSTEGREWHKKHYAEFMPQKWEEKTTKSCPICGKDFETSLLMAYKAVYCSANCKATARRRSEVDNIWRPCDKCGTLVWTNKYAPARFCSFECTPKRGKSKPKS